MTDVTTAFRQFYIDRAQSGLPAERPISKLSEPRGVSLTVTQQIINQGPFDRFSRLDFAGYARDKAFYEINRHVWKQLRQPAEIEKVKLLYEQAIANYYA